MRINARNRLETSYKLTADTNVKAVKALWFAAEKVAKRGDAKIEFFYGVIYALSEIYGRNARDQIILDIIEKSGLYGQVIKVYKKNPEKYGNPVENQDDFLQLFFDSTASLRDSDIIEVLIAEPLAIEDIVEKTAYNRFREAMKH